MKPLSVVLVVMTIGLFNNGDAQGKLYVRKNAYSAAAQADLAAMKRGVQAMKNLPCTDSLSWYYQGAIHHIPDTINGINQLCSQYQNNSQYRTGWSTCPHMLPDLQQYNFLAWHRLYIYYFERIVRHFSGKPDFALPYWDYNNPNERVMPDSFRTPASYTMNPLYEAGRSRYLLAGNAIGANDSDGIVMNVQILGRDTIVPVAASAMDVVLDSSYLMEASDIHHFSYELEDACHNCMHDYVGGTVNKVDVQSPIYNRIYQVATDTLQGLMADVPSAGFDPIFFLHHANIDRLWMTWETRYPDRKLTLDEFMKAGSWPYIFFDENRNRITYTSMKQVYDSIRAINYTYDYLQTQPPLAAKAVKPVMFKAGQAVATVMPAKLLSKSQEKFTLALSHVLKKPANEDVFYSLEVEVSLQKKHRGWLATMIRVDRSSLPQENHKMFVVGVAGFFGAESHGGSGHQEHVHEGGRISKILKYDITKELSLQNGFAAKELDIHFHQFSPDPSSPLFVESISVKEHRRVE